MSEQLRLPFIALRKYHGASQTSTKPRRKKKRSKRKKRDTSNVAFAASVRLEPLGPLDTKRSQSVIHKGNEKEEGSASPEMSPPPDMLIPVRNLNTQLYDRIRFLETRDDVRKSLRSTLIGNSAKIEYIESYSNLHRVTEKTKFHNPDC